MPATETKLQKPTAADMPKEIWAMWSTENQTWLTSEVEEEVLVFFSHDEANEAVTDNLWDEEDLLPVKIYPR